MFFNFWVNSNKNNTKSLFVYFYLVSQIVQANLWYQLKTLTLSFFKHQKNWWNNFAQPVFKIQNSPEGLHHRQIQSTSLIIFLFALLGLWVVDIILRTPMPKRYFFHISYVLQISKNTSILCIVTPAFVWIKALDKFYLKGIERIYSFFLMFSTEYKNCYASSAKHLV